jgi:hypothetical protein
LKRRISRTVGSHYNSLEGDSLACLQGFAVVHDRVGLVVLLIGQVDSVLDGLGAAGNISLRFIGGLMMMVPHEKGDANSSSGRNANSNSNRLTGAVSP